MENLVRILEHNILSFKGVTILKEVEKVLQCSLRENIKFLQKFRPKNNTLEGNF
jgi:hypothetical protein